MFELLKKRAGHGRLANPLARCLSALPMLTVLKHWFLESSYFTIAQLPMVCFYILNLDLSSDGSSKWEHYSHTVWDRLWSTIQWHPSSDCRRSDLWLCWIGDVLPHRFKVIIKCIIRQPFNLIWTTYEQRTSMLRCSNYCSGLSSNQLHAWANVQRAGMCLVDFVL